MPATQRLLWWQNAVNPEAKGVLEGVSICFVAHLANHMDEPPVLREFWEVLNGKEDIEILASRRHGYAFDLLTIHKRIRSGIIVPCLTSKPIWMRDLNLSSDMSIYTSVPSMNVYAIQLGIIISPN